jgi:hypothetical protein
MRESVDDTKHRRDLWIDPTYPGVGRRDSHPRGADSVKRTSVLRFGATHFLLPTDQLRGATGVDAAFFNSLAASSAVFVAHYWIIVLGSMFSVGVILAFFVLLRGHQSGWFCWAALLGLFGATLTATDYALVGVESPRIAERFAASPSAAQSALLLQGIPHVDPCFFGWGLLGISLLISNVAALRAGRLPRFLGSLGILQGLLLLATFAGALARSSLLVDISVGLGGVLVAPIWNVWFGLTLRRVVEEERGT